MFDFIVNLIIAALWVLILWILVPFLGWDICLAQAAALLVVARILTGAVGEDR